MKNAIIDIGSNSVRLLWNGKKVIENTQLAEGLISSGKLNKEAMLRTLLAVKNFKNSALKSGAKRVYAFATEAVRAAENGKEFIEILKNEEIDIELLSPQQESQCGYLGAYTSGTVAIIDIGGASSELTVGDENGIIYSHSLPLGSVRLKDYSLDKNLQYQYAKERVKEYGSVPKFDKLISIGGSVSVIKAVSLKLEPYDANVIHNSVMTYGEMNTTVEAILAVKADERKFIPGMHPKKILVAPAGGVLALAIMEYLGVNQLTLSEKDNLEGYAVMKGIEI